MLRISKRYDNILSIDPSGSFNEGKGTTGWCIINNKNNIINVGIISATQYLTKEAYWDAHVKLIKAFKQKYSNSVLVIEDYLLYANKAKQQINSRLETPQLLGILKYTATLENLPYATQTASEVKQRWNDKVLLWKGLLQKTGIHYAVTLQKGDIKITNPHIRDALRHAIHYNYFKNKSKQEVL